MKTPRENLLSLLDGEAGQWIPFSLDVGSQPGFTEPVLRAFREATGGDDPADYFAADTRSFSIPSSFGGDDPAALHGDLPQGTTFDEWGNAHWAGGQEGTVDRTYPVAAAIETVGQLEALPSPRVADTVDTSAVDAFHRAGYPVFGYGGSIYEWSWWIRGMEQFMVDLVDGSGMAQAVLRKVAAHTTRLALATARAGVDVLCFYDDAGMQTGMQISPRLWRRHVKPAWQGVLDAVRSECPKARFFLHTCGAVQPIVADIVELGFHVLHPVQPECMDFAEIHRRFGRRIVLTATVSSQKTFPFGTPEDVRREVDRLADVVGGDRRALVCPSNVIQPETPWANVVAFAQAARQLRSGGEKR